MTFVTQGLKASCVMGLIINYSAISGLLKVAPVSRWKIQKWRANILKQFCRIGLKVMGVRVTLKGEANHNDNSLVVSNHLSYLDILVIASKIPSCFVTSVEIKK